MKALSRWAQHALLLISVTLVIGCKNAEPSVDGSAPKTHPITPNDLSNAYVVLDESDAQINAWAVLPDDEDVAVLDAALREIFGDETPPRDEATVLRLLAYVPQVFEGRKWVNGRSGSSYLEGQGGFCVGMGSAFVALARRLGFPARVASMHNFAAFRGHTTTEVYYDGAWHHFEPTYGIIFYTRPEYDGEGRIPAFRELVYDKRLLANCLRIPVPLWQAEYVPPAQAVPEPLDPEFTAAPGEAPLRAEYLSYFHESFPIVHHDDMATSHPVLIDLRDAHSVMLGEINGDDLDQFGEHGPEGWPRFAGIRQIGNTRGHTAMALFMIRAPGAGYARLTLHFLNADRKHDDLGVIELKDAVVGNIDSRTGHWSVDVALQSSETALLITHRSGLAYIDAIEASYFETPPE